MSDKKEESMKGQKSNLLTEDLPAGHLSQQLFEHPEKDSKKVQSEDEDSSDESSDDG